VSRSSLPPPPNRRRLRPHQGAAVAVLRGVSCPAVVWDMRLGKTLLAIRAACYYRPRNPATGLRVLIVAPSTVLTAWDKELRAEGVTDIAWLVGDKAARLAKLREWDCTWYLANKEAHLAIGGALAQAPWDHVILDEHFIKNPKAQVTKHFLSNYRRVPHRWWLTGTPMPESELDVVCPMLWLDGRYMGHRDFWTYRAHNYTQFGYDWVAKPGVREAQLTHLAGRALMLRREDVDLGVEKIYQIRTFNLPPPLARAYRTMEDEFISEFEGREQARTVWRGEQYSWLRQLCGGHTKLEGQLTEVWDGKYRELVYLLDSELKGEAVVVWASFTAELQSAGVALARAGVPYGLLTGATPVEDRGRIIAEFNGGTGGRVLLCQTEIGKYGIDLSAAATAIYLSSPLGTETRAQSEDRIVSVATRRAALIIDFVVSDTVDQDVYDMITGKKLASETNVYLAGRLRDRRLRAADDNH